METRNSSTCYSDKHEAPDWFSVRMHICKVTPDFRNCIIRICEDTDDNTKSHDDQTDTKNRVDASDDLINRNKGCNKIV